MQTFNSTSSQINYANIHQAHNQSWHMSTHMMRLNTTPICMWYRSPQGRHVRYICIIITFILNTKYSITFIGYKHPKSTSLDKIILRLMMHEHTTHSAHVQQQIHRHFHLLFTYMHSPTISPSLACNNSTISTSSS